MSWPTFWTKQKSWQSYVLKPLASLVCFVASKRLQKFLDNPPNKQTSATVIVVGNIVVGGSGKTPFILWLANELDQQKISYGIVSRGYGGKSENYPILVNEKSLPQQVGDEPVLFQQRLNCPIAVSPNRVDAIELLTKKRKLDIIISDDGLQHYAMARDIEVIIFDGERGVGNDLCMPAGPLREKSERLKMAKFIVTNGKNKDLKLARFSTKLYKMELTPIVFRRVNNPNKTQPIAFFAEQSVHAIAGIGNPQRFYQTLSSLDIQITEKDFPDHKNYQLNDFNWKEKVKPLLMTEKDAVKCSSFAADDWWYLEVQPTCSVELAQQILKEYTHGR